MVQLARTRPKTEQIWRSLRGHSPSELAPSLAELEPKCVQPNLRRIGRSPTTSGAILRPNSCLKPQPKLVDSGQSRPTLCQVQPDIAAFLSRLWPSFADIGSTLTDSGPTSPQLGSSLARLRPRSTRLDPTSAKLLIFGDLNVCRPRFERSPNLQKLARVRSLTILDQCRGDELFKNVSRYSPPRWAVDNRHHPNFTERFVFHSHASAGQMLPNLDDVRQSCAMLAQTSPSRPEWYRPISVKFCRRMDIMPKTAIQRPMRNMFRECFVYFIATFSLPNSGADLVWTSMRKRARNGGNRQLPKSTLRSILAQWCLFLARS